MLFGTCSCLPTVSSVSRRRLLCASGGSFVAALIGTLVSTSRVAQAQALASSRLVRCASFDHLVGAGE
jgi:hypothetical protein